jgi:hypothetical protein
MSAGRSLSARPTAATWILAVALVCLFANTSVARADAIIGPAPSPSPTSSPSQAASPSPAATATASSGSGGKRDLVVLAVAGAVVVAVAAGAVVGLSRLTPERAKPAGSRSSEGTDGRTDGGAGA